MSTLSLQAGTARGKLLGLNVLPPRRTGRALLTAICYETFFHGCRNTWICRRFMHVGGPTHLPAILPFLEQRITRGGPTARPAPSPWLTPLKIFMSVDILSPLFILQKSVTSRCGNLEESARHPDSFRKADNQCLDAQRNELKPKTDTLSIFFSRQRGNKSENMLHRTMFIGQFLV